MAAKQTGWSTESKLLYDIIKELDRLIGVTYNTSSANSWSLNGNTVGALTTLGTLDNYALPIIINAIERARFDTNGNLAIGTTSALGRLHIKSSGSVYSSTYGALLVENGANTKIFSVTEDGRFGNVPLPNLDPTSGLGDFHFRLAGNSLIFGRMAINVAPVGAGGTTLYIRPYSVSDAVMAHLDGRNNSMTNSNRVLLVDGSNTYNAGVITPQSVDGNFSGGSIISTTRGINTFAAHLAVNKNTANGLLITTTHNAYSDSTLNDGYLGVITHRSQNYVSTLTKPLFIFSKSVTNLNGFDHTGAFIEFRNIGGATGDFIKANNGSTTNYFRVTYLGQILSGNITSPSGQLHLKGTGNGTASLIFLENGGLTNVFDFKENGNAYFKASATQYLKLNPTSLLLTNSLATFTFDLNGFQARSWLPSGGHWIFYTNSGIEYLRMDNAGGTQFNVLRNNSYFLSVDSPLTTGASITASYPLGYYRSHFNVARSSSAYFLATGADSSALIVMANHQSANGINIHNVLQNETVIQNYNANLLLLGHVALPSYPLIANGTASMAKFVRNIGANSGGFDLTGPMLEFVQTTVTGPFIKATDGNNDLFLVYNTGVIYGKGLRLKRVAKTSTYNVVRDDYEIDNTGTGGYIVYLYDATDATNGSVHVVTNSGSGIITVTTVGGTQIVGNDGVSTGVIINPTESYTFHEAGTGWRVN